MLTGLLKKKFVLSAALNQSDVWHKSGHAPLFAQEVQAAERSAVSSTKGQRVLWDKVTLMLPPDTQK